MNVVLLIIIFVLLIGFGTVTYLMYNHYQKLLKRELTRAQKSEQLKTVFIDNISRTLRSPLNAIQGYSNILLEKQGGSLPPEMLQETANNIKNNTDELLTFIAKLVELSKFQGITPSFTFIEVNLSELMASYRREALNIVKPDVMVRVTTNLSPHCKAWLDTNFTHQLMMHLLTNAAKYASEGDITINYSNERKGLKVIISYIGNGQAEMINEDIFSFLQRESALTMTNETANLGLPICKAILDSIGGELDMDVVNGKKTVATMWFPCKMRDRHKGM